MGEAKAVDIELPNGKMMMARVQQLDGGGPQDVGLDRLLSFDAVGEALQGVGSLIIESLDKIKPSRATVEFGLELGVKGGSLVSVFVDGGSTASLKVTLEWESSTRNAGDQTTSG